MGAGNAGSNPVIAPTLLMGNHLHVKEFFDVLVKIKTLKKKMGLIGESLDNHSVAESRE